MPVYRLPVTLVNSVMGRANNVWHVRTSSALGVELGGVSGAVSALRTFYSAFLTTIPTGTTITADFAVDVESSEEVALSWATITATGAGNMAPPHIAMCINWKTAIRGRRARGRTFLGPLVSGVIDGTGTPGSANMTQVQNAAQALVDASKVDNGWAIGVYGLENPAPQGHPPNTSDLPHVHRDILGYTVADKFAVMTSRRP